MITADEKLFIMQYFNILGRTRNQFYMFMAIGRENNKIQFTLFGQLHDMGKTLCGNNMHQCANYYYMEGGYLNQLRHKYDEILLCYKNSVKFHEAR